MKVCQAVLALFTVTSDAFVFPQSKIASRIRGISTGLNNNNSNNKNNINEFEYLLNENGSSDISITPRTRRIVKTLNHNHKKVNLVSSVAVPVQEETVIEGFDENEAESESEASQEEGIIAAERQKKVEIARVKKLKMKEPRPASPLQLWFKNSSAPEIASGLIVPTLLLLYGLTKVWNRTSEKVTGNTDEGLASFSNEMIHYIGNFENMEATKNDWSLKLAFLGPVKKKRMLTAYLDKYAERVPISPESISSLSYVFNIFGMKEDKAADVVADLCMDNGTKSVAGAMKLLFCCNQIFESPEAKEKLVSVKKLCKKTYPDVDEATKETMFENSLHTMGLSGYSNLIKEKGETDTLPAGWQILGLTQEEALAIYEEERNKAFANEVDFIYEGVEDYYNDSGKRVDDDGNLLDEKDIKEEAEKAARGEPTGPAAQKKDGIFECGECSYTLFVAKGRGDKFYGAGFSCPECGCGKDKFEFIDEKDIMN